MSKKTILVAGGTGFIGQAFIKHRLELGDKIIVLGRNQQKIEKIFTDKVQSLIWSELNADCLANCDLVLNLAGANIADKRWSSHRKQAILSSRIDATSTLAQLCATLKADAPRLFNASAIGIYGLQQTAEQLPPAFTETTPINRDHYPDFLSGVAQQWEQATQAAKDATVSVINLRFAVVLDASGGMLKKLLPFYKLGLGQIIGSGKQAFSWISLADVIQSLDFLIEHPEITGPINIVAPQAATQQAFAKILAKALHRPCFLRMPASLAKLLFGQMGEELLLNGQNVYPKNLFELNYPFVYPTLNDFFSTTLGDTR
jgi:uncharacterized protein (TIGR01777 family)